MIMMGFAKDGQINPQLLAERDKHFKISTAEKKRTGHTFQCPLLTLWQIHGERRAKAICDN
jgi:hypothetical protein